MTDLASIPFQRMDGSAATLGDHAGEVGADRQRRVQVRADAEFCSSTYDVTFPVTRKISVVGDEQHPLFAALTAAIPTADGKAEMRERFVGYGMTPSEDLEVLWNLEKFLVGRDGTVVARFAPATPPDDPVVRAAGEAALSS